MTKEKICTSGHTIDAGKDVCQRCGALEPKSEQVEPTPIPQDENTEEKTVDEIIEEETELDEAKEAEENPLTEQEEADTI
mgnify:CR=1 FL=1